MTTGDARVSAGMAIQGRLRDRALSGFDVDPTTLLGELEEILGGMAWQLPLAGASAKADDIVITGSVVTALELTGGDTVTVSLASGAAVSVHVERTA